MEFLFPYEHPPEAIAAQLARHKLVLALFNLPPGNWAAGERGLAALPDRFEAVRAGVEAALPYAEATGVARLHLMAGLADPADPAARAAYRRAVAWSAERLDRAGLDLVLEPINGRDMPGYFLDDFDAAAALIADLGLPNLKLQFDLYHCQIMHGDVATRLRAMLPLVGHVQTASVPSRQEPGSEEPGSEEVNDAFLFAELDRLGYAGFVGCEYFPRAGTREGLGWFEPYRASQRPAASI